jgi:hypothetical protein
MFGQSENIEKEFIESIEKSIIERQAGICET